MMTKIYIHTTLGSVCEVHTVMNQYLSILTCDTIKICCQLQVDEPEPDLDKCSSRLVPALE